MKVEWDQGTYLGWRVHQRRVRRPPEARDGGHRGEAKGAAPGEGCSMVAERPPKSVQREDGSAVASYKWIGHSVRPLGIRVYILCT